MIYTKKMGGVGSGYILKVEASQFPNKLDMREAKMASRFPPHQLERRS